MTMRCRRSDRSDGTKSAGRRLPPPDPPDYLRAEQRWRRDHQVCHLQKRSRQRAVARRGKMELADVPVDETQHRRARALNLRMAKVAANRDVPRNVDDLRGGLKESPC